MDIRDELIERIPQIYSEIDRQAKQGIRAVSLKSTVRKGYCDFSFMDIPMDAEGKEYHICGVGLCTVSLTETIDYLFLLKPSLHSSQLIFLSLADAEVEHNKEKHDKVWKWFSMAALGYYGKYGRFPPAFFRKHLIYPGLIDSAVFSDLQIRKEV